ncbi:MAG: AAA family ATPase, partial [Legionellales bacterium]|nr:AAA family ATPase [Legionellales bacterium]
MSNAATEINDIIIRAESILKKIEALGRLPNQKKTLKHKFTGKQAEELVKRRHQSICRAEKILIKNKLMEEVERNPKTGRIMGYSLKQINQLRKHFKTMPYRNNDTDDCIILAVQSFKGGVGKTVTSVTLSHYFAMQGYRVCLADFDSQGTTTSSFGYIPDRDISFEDTCLPYFEGKEKDLQYCIRKTYWDQLDLIPANLQIYNLEYALSQSMANMTMEERKEMFRELRTGLEPVKKNYDIIILDSPPALGITSINILCAADAIIVPTPPSMYDFSSTIQFFRMISEVLEAIMPEKSYLFIKILATKVNLQQITHQDFLSVMKDVFGEKLFSSLFLRTAEIENAASNFQTILEEPRP